MSRSYPHLLAGLLALFLAGAALWGGSLYATHLETLYANTLDLLRIRQVTAGSALQKAALNRPDLLAVFGSSELQMETDRNTDFIFFRNYPTGFTVFHVARLGGTSLINALDLAGLGTELRGKKVVISFTPYSFDEYKITKIFYDGTFSQLHADALAFNLDLTFNTKHLAAVRMLDYPETLLKTPLLKFALQNLAANGAHSRLFYDLSVPLGQIETTIIALQDHWEVLDYIWRHPNLKPDNLNQTPVKIDWKNEIEQAEKEEKADATTNPYGVENYTWLNGLNHAFRVPMKPGSGDKFYLDNMNVTKEWNDLQITLEILNELGAKPLILSHPYDGALETAAGVSPRARQVYYDRLEKLVAAYHMPLVDFRQHDQDLYFNIDKASHTSVKGWVYVDQALDEFYHGNLP
jgi:D-alanine transfer protein